MEVDTENGKGKEGEGEGVQGVGENGEEEEGMPSWLPPLPHERTYKRERGEKDKEAGERRSSRVKKKRRTSGSSHLILSHTYTHSLSLKSSTYSYPQGTQKKEQRIMMLFEQGSIFFFI